MRKIYDKIEEEEKIFIKKYRRFAIISDLTGLLHMFLFNNPS
jgi:hypothetical protein